MIRKAAVILLLAVLAAFVWFVAFSDKAGGHWKEARRQNTIEAYRTFLNQHPQGQYSQLASNELVRLQEAKDWAEATAKPSIPALRAFQKRFPGSSKLSESLTMLTNAFFKEWEDTRVAFDRERYTDFISLGPPQTLEAEARFMLRVLDRAKEFGIARLQTMSLRPSDISSSGKILTFQCKGPLNLGPLSLPDGVVMEVSCSSDTALQHGQLTPGSTAVLCWGLGALPKGSRTATMGISYGNRLNPYGIFISDAQDSLLLSVRTKDKSLLKFNDNADGNAFFTPVALLNPKESK
jgi:hypothetical protein